MAGVKEILHLVVAINDVFEPVFKMLENRPGPPHSVGTRSGFEWNRFSGKDALIELPQVMLQPNFHIQPGERNPEKLPVEIDCLNDRKWIDVRGHFLPCIFKEDDF